MPRVLGIENGTINADESLKTDNGQSTRIKKHSLVYLVLGDTLADTEDTILATSGIPPLYYLYKGAYCKSRKAVEDTRITHPSTQVACGLWKVTAEFDSTVDPTQNENLPEARRPVVRWRGELEGRVLTYDVVTGEAIATDAGEPIFFEEPVVLPILEITRYERGEFDPDIMLYFANRCNSQPFWGAPEGCVWMFPMETDEEMLDIGESEPVLYTKVMYLLRFEIEEEKGSDRFKKDTISKVNLLHQGQKFRKVADGPVQIYTDKGGNPAVINLTAGGLKLPADSPAEYKTYNRKKKRDFNALSLGPFNR